MEYPITFEGELTLCWETRYGTVDIDFSDEEVAQIRSVAVAGDSKATQKAISEAFPEIFDKIYQGGLNFYWYLIDLDIRLSGQWKDCARRDIYEDSLMQEDIQYNGFDPHDEKGNKLSGDDLYQHWLKWEEENLNDLNFCERSYFYQRRYDFDDVNYEEIGDVIFHLPESLISQK